jgi:hypothetical protein
MQHVSNLPLISVIKKDFGDWLKGTPLWRAHEFAPTAMDGA